MTCHPSQSRRNGSVAASHKEEWEQAHSETLPMRYRLHYPDGSRTIRCGRMGLVDEVRGTMPIRIERLPFKNSEIAGKHGLTVAG